MLLELHAGADVICAGRVSQAAVNAAQGGIYPGSSKAGHVRTGSLLSQKRVAPRMRTRLRAEFTSMI